MTMGINPIQSRLADCRDEGFDARMAELNMSDNPYSYSSCAWIRWRNGWRDANLQLQELQFKLQNEA